MRQCGGRGNAFNLKHLARSRFRQHWHNSCQRQLQRNPPSHPSPCPSHKLHCPPSRPQRRWLWSVQRSAAAAHQRRIGAAAACVCAARIHCRCGRRHHCHVDARVQNEGRAAACRRCAIGKHQRPLCDHCVHVPARVTARDILACDAALLRSHTTHHSPWNRAMVKRLVRHHAQRRRAQRAQHPPGARPRRWHQVCNACCLQ